MQRSSSSSLPIDESSGVTSSTSRGLVGVRTPESVQDRHPMVGLWACGPLISKRNVAPLLNGLVSLDHHSSTFLQTGMMNYHMVVAKAKLIWQEVRK